MDQGETKPRQTPTAEKPCLLSGTPWNQLGSVNQSAEMNFQGWLRVVCCSFLLATLSVLLRVLLLIKEYPFSFPLKRCLLCLCNFWIPKLRPPPIESTCTIITSFILLSAFIIIGFDRIWDIHAHFIHWTFYMWLWNSYRNGLATEQFAV